MTWLGIWIELSVLAGLEIARVIGWGNPTPSEPEPATGNVVPLQPTTAALIREVLARGRRDGLSDVQIAGGIEVVLDSHGLLQGEAV